MRLLYDLDDTVAHFRRRFTEVRVEHFPDHTGIPVLDEHPSFNLWEGRTEDEKNVISQIMDWENFYRDLEPYEGAVDAVHEAAALGHEIFFLSAPWTTNKTCASDKYAWVADHFGEDYARKLVLSKDKTIVAGDILFDDKHPIENREAATWTQVYMDAPYNRDQPGYRIKNWTDGTWKDIVTLIQEQKLAEAARVRDVRPVAFEATWDYYDRIGEFKLA